MPLRKWKSQKCREKTPTADQQDGSRVHKEWLAYNSVVKKKIFKKICIDISQKKVSD